MPRAGLSTSAVVAAGAALADEVGFNELTMAQLARRMGVRSPSLYKHVASQSEMNRNIAALALNEVADAVGVAIQGRSGRDALRAAARALREFLLTHPGRSAAIDGLPPTGPDDPIAIAAKRALQPFEAILHGYDIPPEDLTHALRALRSIFSGFPILERAGGFQGAMNLDDSFEWLIDLVDRGLRTNSHAPSRPSDPAPSSPNERERG